MVQSLVMDTYALSYTGLTLCHLVDDFIGLLQPDGLIEWCNNTYHIVVLSSFHPTSTIRKVRSWI